MVLVNNSKLMMEGVRRDAIPVLDLEDKITCLAQEDTVENKTACVIRGLKSSIGEISNYSTAYHNRVAKTEESKKTYENYTALLSIINGKMIDFSKTGVAYSVPRNIATYGRPLPYFMKYAGPYYARMKSLSKSHSNMNLLCLDLERWERSVRWRKDKVEFDWHILFDDEIGYDEEIYNEIEKLFLDFNQKRVEAFKFEMKCHNWAVFHQDIEDKITKEEAKNYQTNWQSLYDIYRNKCKLICPDVRELANILVKLCYEKYPTKFRKFAWHMAGAGIVENIKPVPIQLPVKDPNGEYEYLGQRYSLSELQSYEARVSKR